MSFENARGYLARVLPWPQDGDEPAYINLHWSLTKNDQRGKPIWTGRAVRSVDEAVRALDFALKGRDTKDIYVCLSTQRRAQEKVSGKGFKYFAPIRGQDNAVALKSLFLDIDAKPGPNGYANMDEAVRAFAKFVKDMDLPKPSIMVRSGGGLHVYWTLERALTPHDWQPLANALAEATKVHGLKCDTQCTIDSARVLRVPDTFNRKTDEERPVRVAGTPTDFDYSLERIERVLAPYKSAQPAKVTPSVAWDLPIRAPVQGVSDLSAGMDAVKPAAIDIDQVATQCAFINDAITTGGKDLANPLWNLTTLLATFCVDGRKQAHRMAAGHPGYSQQSTDELYDRKEIEKEAKGIGWPSCRTISATGSAACQACPHFARGKSPLHTPAYLLSLATNGVASSGSPAALTPNQTTAPTPATNDLPAGYMRRTDNVVCRVMVEPDGTQSYLPVCNYPMFNGRLRHGEPVVLMFATTKNGIERTISITSGAETASKDQFRKRMHEQNILIQENETNAVKEFLVAWIGKLQDIKAYDADDVPAFGWVTKDGNLAGFSYNRNCWSSGQPLPAAGADPTLSKYYTPAGQLSIWQRASKLITDQRRPTLDAILASAFAAPLVRFTGQPGLLMGAYSTESGNGKTTALKVAQSVWGDPVKALQGLDDTLVSIFIKAGTLRSLPLYWDEIKGKESSDKFAKLAFQLSSGKEKSRGTQSVTLRDVGSWQTLLVSATNDSLMDAISRQAGATTAGLYRIFEYVVDPVDGSMPGRINIGEAADITTKLNDNYGFPGLEYAKFLGKNFNTIGPEVLKYQNDLMVTLKGTSEERFWFATMACLTMGAKYANQLKLTDIDEDALVKFLGATLTKMRGLRQDTQTDLTNTMNVSDLLAEFLAENRARNTLKTENIHLSAGKPPAAKIINDVSRLDSLRVHIGGNGVLRISSTAFSNWLQTAGHSRHVVMEALKREFGATITKARLGAGTQFVGAQQYLIEINTNANANAKQFLEGV